MNEDQTIQIKNDFSLLMRSTQQDLAKIRRHSSGLTIAVAVLMLVNIFSISFYFSEKFSRAAGPASKLRVK